MTWLLLVSKFMTIGGWWMRLLNEWDYFLNGTFSQVSVLAKMSTEGDDLLSDWQSMSLLKFLHHFALPWVLASFLPVHALQFFGQPWKELEALTSRYAGGGREAPGLFLQSHNIHNILLSGLQPRLVEGGNVAGELSNHPSFIVLESRAKEWSEGSLGNTYDEKKIKERDADSAHWNYKADYICSLRTSSPLLGTRNMPNRLKRTSFQGYFFGLSWLFWVCPHPQT